MIKNILLLILTGIFLCFIIGDAIPQNKIPPNSIQYLPILKQIIERDWPQGTPKCLMAGQVEQETCISLTHKKCWSPTAELKTSREYGFGLGQITLAYDSSGRERFNNFLDVKKIDKRLEKWEWADRYNPNYQLQALVMKNRYNYNLMKGWSADHENKMNFTLNAYNGGLGGLIKDRQLCQTKTNCNPNIWFDNVALYSYKSKNKVSGYGKSFFEINREYVDNIRNKRSAKYTSYLESLPAKKEILPIKKECWITLLFK